MSEVCQTCYKNKATCKLWEKKIELPPCAWNFSQTHSEAYRFSNTPLSGVRIKHQWKLPRFSSFFKKDFIASLFHFSYSTWRQIKDGFFSRDLVVTISLLFEYWSRYVKNFKKTTASIPCYNDLRVRNDITTDPDTCPINGQSHPNDDTCPINDQSYHNDSGAQESIKYHNEYHFCGDCFTSEGMIIQEWWDEDIQNLEG